MRAAVWMLPLVLFAVGWLCGLAFSFMIGYGCDRSKIDWKTCVGIGATPALACSILF